jgi:hypothetical protein
MAGAPLQVAGTGEIEAFGGHSRCRLPPRGAAYSGRRRAQAAFSSADYPAIV